MKEISTYQDLLDALNGLTPEQLKQPVQLGKSTGDDSKPVTLQAAIAIGTVEYFEFSGARSIIDNKYHGDDVVILFDGNPFSPEGVVAWELGDGKLEAPIYGKDGPTLRKDQMAPNWTPPNDENFGFSPAQSVEIKHRVGRLNRYAD